MSMSLTSAAPTGRLIIMQKNCEDVPYDEEFFSSEEECLFGSWLKNKANEYSPL